MSAQDRVPQARRPPRIPSFHPRPIQGPASSSHLRMVSQEEYNRHGARLRQVRGAPVGLYKRKDSRFWWMGYTANGEQRCESTKTSSKDLAKRIWKKCEAEIALGRFQVGWPGERIAFAELCEEFFRSHSSTLSLKSQENHQIFGKHLGDYFGDRKLTGIDERS